MPPERRLRRRRNHQTGESPHREPVASVRAAGPRGRIASRLASHVNRRRAHHLTYLNRHVEWFSTFARRSRRLCRDLIRALRAVYVDNPVAREKLFRLRKHTIGDRTTILARAHQLGLPWHGESFGTHELPRLGQSARELLHETDVGLQIVWRPLRDSPVPVSLWRIHHQHELHVMAPSWFIHEGVGANRSFSTSQR